MSNASAGLSGALIRYRVMAIITGTLLLVVTVGMLRYLPGIDVSAGTDTALLMIAQIHGFVYMVYLVTCVQLWLAMKWSLPRAVLLASGGIVPMLGFWIEHKVVREVRAAYPQLSASPTDA